MTTRTSLTKFAPVMQDPQPDLKAADMAALQAGAWERKWLCVHLDDPRLDDWERAKANAIGTKLFGQRRV